MVKTLKKKCYLWWYLVLLFSHDGVSRSSCPEIMTVKFCIRRVRNFKRNHTDIAEIDFLFAICSVIKNLDFFLKTRPFFMF